MRKKNKLSFIIILCLLYQSLFSHSIVSHLNPPIFVGTDLNSFESNDADVSFAYLADGNSFRYQHFVLGRELEPTTLRVILKNGEQLQYLLGFGVFEDRQIRLVDLDFDQRVEMMVVVSEIGKGSRLAIFGIRNNKITELASTKPIGKSFRWLNPIGAFNADGFGNLEVALVETPHIGGIVRVYQYQTLRDDNNKDVNRLVEIAHLKGFSNHQIGESDLNFHHCILKNYGTNKVGEGIDAIHLPNQYFNRFIDLVLSISENSQPHIIRANIHQQSQCSSQ